MFRFLSQHWAIVQEFLEQLHWLVDRLFISLSLKKGVVHPHTKLLTSGVYRWFFENDRIYIACQYKLYSNLIWKITADFRLFARMALFDIYVYVTAPQILAYICRFMQIFFNGGSWYTFKNYLYPYFGRKSPIFPVFLIYEFFYPWKTSAPVRDRCVWLC
jgi:hypothetical protein